nr:T9SS type A sorting domain-containing protein [Bacteroidota bacterium]
NLSAIFYQNINVDWTAPSTVDTINDGTGADIAITTASTDLSANWSASADPNSAISRYWYAIGTTPGATDVMTWTDNWFSRTVTVTGLSLVNLQTYYFSIKSEDGAGLLSPVFTSNGQTVQLTTGINELGSNSITVFPNPFTNTTNLSYYLTESSDVEITLTDVLGKQITLLNADKSQGKHELSINATEHNLAKGMYFIKLKTSSGQKTIKMILR